MLLNPSWLKKHGVWPVLLSSPLTVDQQAALSQFNIKEFDFTFDTNKQLLMWKEQLEQSSLDTGCQFLWGGRGGYGTTRLLGMLSRDEIETYFKGKVFIGYSDLTAIHQIYARYNWPSFHGAVLAEFISHDKNIANIEDLLELCEKGYTDYSVGSWKKISSGNRKKSSQALSHQGMISGGNLSILQCGIGTDWLNIQKHNYLFLEDVHVKPYQIDRMLWHLYQAGLFKGIRAIFIGDLGADCNAINEILAAWSHRLKIDIFIDQDFGHGPRNKPLVFHTPFKLKEIDEGLYTTVFS